MPNESHENPCHHLGAGGSGVRIQTSLAVGRKVGRVAISALLILVLLTSGCAQSTPQQVTSVKQPQNATEPAPASESDEVLRPHVASSDFSGKWSVEWCSRTNPELDCGGFTATLAQDGDRVCGNYGGALVNLRQVDEGGIIGTVVGDVAVLAVESTRNGTIALVRAELHGDQLHWKEVDNIIQGSSDTAIIATDDVLARTATAEKVDSPHSCSTPAASPSSKGSSTPAMLPTALIGVWYRDDAVGRAQCDRYRALPKDIGETDEGWISMVGSIVITPALIHEYSEYGEGNFNAIKEIASLGDGSWRVKVQIGIDSIPADDADLVVETHLLELRKERLIWEPQRAYGRGAHGYFRCESVRNDLYQSEH